MNSIWKMSSVLPKFPVLDKDLETDVLIIGGGLCGILCAHMLQKAGVDYALLESDKICGKTTENTTAKITAQHGLIYGKIANSRGKDFARLYYDANINALNEYKSLCKDIDCDFCECDSYVFTLNNEEKLKKEFKILKELGIDAEFTDHLSIPFDVKGAIKFPKQACFNPLKFISCISKDLNIYEYSRVEELIKSTAKSNGHTVKAKRIIVATHFPFNNKHGLYFLKLYQHRSYVLALEGADEIKNMYINDTSFGLSLRGYNGLTLLGGEGHRTGKFSEGWAGVEKIAQRHFPNAKIKYRWATQDCMTLDGVPYIGKYSLFSDNLYVATGFNKWGITSSMVAAKLLCDLILGRNNQYERLFSPSRSMIKPQLVVNSAEAIGNLLSFKTKRCPHLGCALVWNKNERSWDCPCHGSRFDEKGHVLDGPATNDLNPE
ncbi:MAG: FAD-dependent oxidoreductase [Clostridia bacterium]|nr:FAD-dependent oxidoreductase [Clostridia bacterium]MBQ8146967.1 FAD-dependent oxidoreductase [Clostridia bacterium]